MCVHSSLQWCVCIHRCSNVYVFIAAVTCVHSSLQWRVCIHRCSDVCASIIAVMCVHSSLQTCSDVYAIIIAVIHVHSSVQAVDHCTQQQPPCVRLVMFRLSMCACALEQRYTFLLFSADIMGTLTRTNILTKQLIYSWALLCLEHSTPKKYLIRFLLHISWYLTPRTRGTLALSNLA